MSSNKKNLLDLSPMCFSGMWRLIIDQSGQVSGSHLHEWIKLFILVFLKRFLSQTEVLGTGDSKAGKATSAHQSSEPGRSQRLEPKTKARMLLVRASIICWWSDLVSCFWREGCPLEESKVTSRFEANVLPSKIIIMNHFQMSRLRKPIP